MNSFFSLFTLFMLFTSFTFLHGAGATSADFLTLGVGPRAAAMGELGVAASRDAYAAYWNPAALVRLNAPEISLMHGSYVDQINYQYLAYAHPLPLATAAFSVTRLGVAPFAAYDIAGNPNGTVNAGDWAVGFSLGSSLYSGKLALGAGGKWIREQLGPMSASAFAADAGFLYRAAVAGGFQDKGALRIGLALLNAGTGLKFDRERYPLPQMLRLGAAYEQSFLGKPYVLGVEGVYPNQGSPFLAGGAEIWPSPMIALRFGLRNASDADPGLRLGFGLKLAQVMIDYAWAGLGTLGMAHRMGVTMRFGPSRPETIRSAHSHIFPMPPAAAQAPMNPNFAVDPILPTKTPDFSVPSFPRKRESRLSQNLAPRLRGGDEPTAESRISFLSEHQSPLFAGAGVLVILVVIAGIIFSTTARRPPYSRSKQVRKSGPDQQPIENKM